MYYFLVHDCIPFCSDNINFVKNLYRTQNVKYISKETYKRLENEFYIYKSFVRHTLKIYNK